MRELTHLDLFSGIGGFALAARWAGFKTIAFCEKDKFCQKVLNKHWPDVFISNDIHDFKYTNSVDILTASMPCQPFSSAGKKKGKNDERYLWPELFRVVKECRPGWIISENVPGMVELALASILDDLESEGYCTQSYLIPACASGAPHRRERLWIIAHRNSIGGDIGKRYWKRRYLQENQEWNLEEIQSQWQKLIPNAWKIMQAGDWLEYNASIM